MQIDIPTPEWAVPFLEPARYKVAYGGRASGKSHAFAENLIDRCLDGGVRAVCIREVQSSIKDSVRQLLVDKIQKFGLGTQFEVMEQEIRCPGNGLILFRGMQSYNAENIKSLENIDIAWVEEAQTLSAHSLRLLRPTIRKPGSELWFTYNPRHETDAVDAFFCGKAPPADSVIRAVNWQDNPWLPDVMRQEMRADYASDPEMADHVWGGGYERITDASYYAKHIAAAEREQRIGHYPYDSRYQVMTAWDLGIDDYTAIWFIQEIDGKPRIIDYYESSGFGLDENIRAALPELNDDVMERAASLVEMGRDRSFKYGMFYFPHDIRARDIGNGMTRVETVMQENVPRRLINVGSQNGPVDRINATRRILPLCTFNRTENVMLGISRLRRYRRKENVQMGTLGGPLHDDASHGSDAFGEFAVNWAREVEPYAPPPIKEIPQGMVMLSPPPEPGLGPRRTAV